MESQKAIFASATLDLSAGCKVFSSHLREGKHIVEHLASEAGQISDGGLHRRRHEPPVRWYKLVQLDRCHRRETDLVFLTKASLLTKGLPTDNVDDTYPARQLNGAIVARKAPCRAFGSHQ